MNLTDYFDISDALPVSTGLAKNASIYGKIQILGISKGIQIEANSLVIFGVKESRNSSNPGAAQSADAIRKYLYSLSGVSVKQPLVDLGNLKVTQNPSDTYMAVRDVVGHIHSKGATCIVLGGTQEITWPLYMAIAESTKRINLSIIDYTIDMGSNDGDFSSTCYIDKILSESAETLFSLNLLGYQGYLVDSKHIDLLTAQNHELMRLGYVRGAMADVEPILRDSHIVSLDMGCIKRSDSPGSIYPSPNGFYSEEVCQLARYSGVSTNARVFGIFELNTLADRGEQSASLGAQIAWHFIDGFNARAKHPQASEGQLNVKRFYVKSPIPNIQMVFLQNTLNNTWWFEFPATPNTGDIPMVVACSYSDYQKASKGDVPERWMRAWRRMT